MAQRVCATCLVRAKVRPNVDIRPCRELDGEILLLCGLAGFNNSLKDFLYVILAVLDPVREDSHTTVSLKHLDNNDLAWIGQVNLVTMADNLCNHVDDSHTIQ